MAATPDGIDLPPAGMPIHEQPVLPPGVSALVAPEPAAAPDRLAGDQVATADLSPVRSRLRAITEPAEFRELIPTSEPEIAPRADPPPKRREPDAKPKRKRRADPPADPKPSRRDVAFKRRAWKEGETFTVVTSFTISITANDKAGKVKDVPLVVRESNEVRAEILATENGLPQAVMVKYQDSSRTENFGTRDPRIERHVVSGRTYMLLLDGEDANVRHENGREASDNERRLVLTDLPGLSADGMNGCTELSRSAITANSALQEPRQLVGDLALDPAISVEELVTRVSGHSKRKGGEVAEYEASLVAKMALDDMRFGIKLGGRGETYLAGCRDREFSLEGPVIMRGAIDGVFFEGRGRATLTQKIDYGN